WQQVGWQKVAPSIESLEIIGLPARALLIRLTFGYIACMFFMAITIAGEIMSVSLGLAAGQLFNPAMGELSSAFDQFYIILATLFFLGIGGHHILVGSFFDSYTVVPLAQKSISFSGLRDLAPLAQTVMIIGLKL